MLFSEKWHRYKEIMVLYNEFTEKPIAEKEERI